MDKLVGVIIQARMGSTRFPGKVMKLIGEKPMLYYSVKRAKLSKYSDIVIVATTPNSPEIIQWCDAQNIPVFVGSEQDVLDRYYQAAKKYNLDIVIRVTSDNPFVDPEIIDLLVLTLKNIGYDYVSNRLLTRTWPIGLDVEVMTFEALERNWELAEKPEEREHVTPYIMGHPENFFTAEVLHEKEIVPLSLTVDYPKDFEIAKKVLETMVEKHGIGFSWKALF